ncbi:hypothetical protein V6X63_09900 [Spiribacter sp. 221]|uniref:hypothetical protein n=1 Tax=Spiribacter onubensis TaxID=3122420 RepID=UPI00349FA004
MSDRAGAVTSDDYRPPSMAQARRPNAAYKAGIFLIGGTLLPPLLLLEAWKTNSERYRHWILTFFFTIYGATITIAFDPLGVGADGVRHLLHVYAYYQGLSFDEFAAQLGQIILLQENPSPSADVYKHVLSYALGGVLGLPWLFFPVVATVYGYFFTGSMLIIFKHWGKAKLPWITLFLIASFFLFKNIEGVNTVRTWTGLWVLVYACLQYYQTRKKRYLVLMAMPPFIHFGYFLMALPAYAVWLLGTRVMLYSVFFVMSSFTTVINPGQFEEIAATTELGGSRFDAYYRDSLDSADEIIASSQESGQRFWRAFQKAGVQKWALNIFVYALLMAGVYRYAMNAFQKRIFSVGLLTLALSNSVWFIYAASNRSWIVGAIFIFAAFVMSRTDPSTVNRWPYHNSYLKVGLALSGIAFIPYFLYNLSTMLDFPSVYLVALPIVPWLVPDANMSLKEFLQILLIEMLKIL